MRQESWIHKQQGSEKNENESSTRTKKNQIALKCGLHFGTPTLSNIFKYLFRGRWDVSPKCGVVIADITPQDLLYRSFSCRNLMTSTSYRTVACGSSNGALSNKPKLDATASSRQSSSITTSRSMSRSRSRSSMLRSFSGSGESPFVCPTCAI